jgi:protein-S-isoprenylcysteine O-methyltransferase Ste14
MPETVIFLLGSGAILLVSRTSLRQPGSHGYYRFFVFETILVLFVHNIHGWFAEPFAWHQILSWILLTASLVPLVWGIRLLRRAGKPTDALESTTELVTEGVYHTIRHPLYASLLYLAWGIFFKSPSLLDGLLAALATAFLHATARADENECRVKFGADYVKYMKGTKMFVPRLW